MRSAVYWVANTVAEPIYATLPPELTERIPHVMTAEELAPILIFSAIAVALAFLAAGAIASENMRRALQRKGQCYECLVGDACKIMNKKVRDAADAWHP